MRSLDNDHSALSPIRRPLACLAVLLLCLAPRAALADPVSDAKDLFTQGRDLRVHGDCASAIALFRKAHDLYPAGLGTLRNIAECQEALRQFASARRTWLDLKRDLVTSPSPKYDGWANDADQAAARLAPKVATIKIDLSIVRASGEAAPSDGVEVTLNGESVPTGLSGTPLERDPGRYLVRVAGPRVGTPEQSTVDLGEGEAKSVSFRVIVADAQGAVRPGQASPPPLSVAPSAPDTTQDATQRTLAWIAVGTGAASLMGAAISLAVYASAQDDLNRGCPPPHQNCPSSVSPAVNQGQTAATLVNVFTTVGLAGLGGGIVLLVTSRGHDTPPAAVALSPTGVWAIGRF
jgi:hypothetical protein